MNKKISNLYINILLVIFFILIVDVSIQLYFGYNLTGHSYVGNRPTSFFGEEQILGSYVVRNLSFVIPIYLLVNNRLNYKFYTILFFSIILITLSKERVSFFIY